MSDEQGKRPRLPGARSAPVVVVYLTPGSEVAASLQRDLKRAGIETEVVDITQDPDGAAFVRNHANGAETVPTVDVAGKVMVNPAVHHVLRVARAAGFTASEGRRWWNRG